MGETPAKLEHTSAATSISAEDLPIFKEFVGEARGHLAAAESHLLALEADPRNAEAIDAIFRCFHTIKGVAGFLNLNQVGALAHAAESLLNPARGAGIALGPADVDLLLQAVDQMNLLIAGVADAVEHAHPLVELPGLEAFLLRLGDRLEKLPERVDEDATLANTPPRPAETSAIANAGATTGGTVTVSTERLDALINMAGELVIAQSMVSRDVAQIAGEDERLTRNTTHLGKITRELQELSMSMRMVPIQGVFQKMTRLARDLARKAQKQIEFVAIGSETELDRNLIEAIGDPLVHMVRNAVDHGIESAEQRAAANKPAQGHIQLKAWQQAGCIVIQLKDDGGGLDKEKILRKAVDTGLVAPDAQLTDQEIFRLIFHAGLSTAEQVTEVSGRGVGMDVVLKNVERLHGRIEIDSEPGRGSTFTVRLPLTLAVIDGLIVAVGGHRYILPLTSIDTSFKARPEQISTVQDRAQLCRVRDELLPLFHLHRLFGIADAIDDPCAGLIVVVEDDQRKCCLLVDAIVDQQQVVIKGLGDEARGVAGVSGGAILGDGSVSLILDVPGIIELARQRHRRVA